MWQEFNTPLLRSSMIYIFSHIILPLITGIVGGFIYQRLHRFKCVKDTLFAIQLCL